MASEVTGLFLSGFLWLELRVVRLEQHQRALPKVNPAAYTGRCGPCRKCCSLFVFGKHLDY